MKSLILKGVKSLNANGIKFQLYRWQAGRPPFRPGLSLSVEGSVYILSISFLASKYGLDEMALLLIECRLGRCLHSLLAADYLFIRFPNCCSDQVSEERKDFTFLSYYFL